jgi:hypothetical protein
MEEVQQEQEQEQEQEESDEDCDCDEEGVLVCSKCAEPVDLSISHCPSCGVRLHWEKSRNDRNDIMENSGE